MKRSDKYVDTDTFHFYNANPKNRITGDCVTRAVATATGIPYNQVVLDMAQIQIETGYDAADSKGLEKLMEKYGWVKHRQPRKENGRKFTGSDFCHALWFMTYPAVIANIGGNHTVAIKEVYCPDDATKYKFKVHDIWDSTSKCIGNYWTREA